MIRLHLSRSGCHSSSYPLYGLRVGGPPASARGSLVGATPGGPAGGSAVVTSGGPAAPSRLTQTILHARRPLRTATKHLLVRGRGTTLRQNLRTMVENVLQASMHRPTWPSAGGTTMLVKNKQQRNTNRNFCFVAMLENNQRHE
jgi:hypothetical protein